MGEYYLTELKKAQFILEAVTQYAKAQLATAKDSTEWTERMATCAEIVKGCVRDVNYYQELIDKEKEDGGQNG